MALDKGERAEYGQKYGRISIATFYPNTLLNGVKRLDTIVQKRYVTALTPYLRSGQSFTAKFSNEQVEMVKGGWLNSPLAPFDSITQQFLSPVRAATTLIRAFYRNPPSRRNRAFTALVSRQRLAWVLDHSRDALFDARFVFIGMRDTGLRLVYSFDSAQVDLAGLLSALWNPQVLTNPGTTIGPVTVRYAKSIPANTSTLRFVFDIQTSYPDVLVYAPRERITNVFALAVKHANFIPQLVRGLDHTYGRKPAA